MTKQTKKGETVNVVKPEECSSKTGEVKMTTDLTKEEIRERDEWDALEKKRAIDSVKKTMKVNEDLEDISRSRLVDGHVHQTNLAIGDVHKSNRKLFDAVKNAYLAMKDDAKAMGKYKANVDIDRSSINKIIAIVSNETLIRFSEKLPVSWGTLYALSKMEAANLVEAIGNKKIASDSTLAEVNAVRSSYKGKQSDAGEKKADKKSNEIEVNTCWVDFDELPNLSSKDSANLITLLSQLYNYGIQVTGVDLFVNSKAA